LTDHGRCCSVCSRPYLLESRFFDLSACCPRGGEMGDAGVIACLLEGVRRRDEVIALAEEMRSWYRKQMGPEGPEDEFDAALAKLRGTVPRG
jgi:hypothetical protein